MAIDINWIRDDASLARSFYLAARPQEVGKLPTEARDVILVAMAWGYTQVFSGRAALLHLGDF